MIYSAQTSDAPLRAGAKYPIGSSERRLPGTGAVPYAPHTMLLLEISLVALSIVSFWLLDRYVIGCERI